MPKTTKIVLVTLVSVLALIGIAIGGYVAVSGNSVSSGEDIRATIGDDERAENMRKNNDRFPDGQTPGATVDGDQRSWPDVFNPDIDAQFSTPGRWSVESLFSRQVFTPIDPLGDLPATSDLVDSPERCDDETLHGGVQLQYVKARFLSVNAEAGPSRMERAVPRGYAHSPQGAVMAAINQMTYGIFAQGDEVGEEIDKALWADSAQAKEEREFRGIDKKGPSRLARATMIPGATGYKIISCSPELVTVEVVVGTPDDSRPDSAMAGRIAMRWSGKDWQADLAGANDSALVRPMPSSLDGYRLVEYR